MSKDKGFTRTETEIVRSPGFVEMRGKKGGWLITDDLLTEEQIQEVKKEWDKEFHEQT